MKAAYFGNPWLGMFVKTNDKFTMLPIDSMDKLEGILRERLGTTTVRLNAGRPSARENLPTGIIAWRGPIG